MQWLRRSVAPAFVTITMLLVACGGFPGKTAARPTSAVSSSPDVALDRQAIRLSGPSSPITKLAWSPDASLLAAAAGEVSATETRIWMWSGTDALVATLTGHTRAVRSLSWSANGPILASGSMDGTVRLWGADGTAKGILATYADPVFRVAWSPDSQLLAIGTIAIPSVATPGVGTGLPATIHLLRPDGAVVSTMPVQYTGGKFLNLAWSPDGRFLAAGVSDFHVWRADGAPIATLRARGTPAVTMAWSSDSQSIAIGDEDGVVALFAVTGESRAEIHVGLPVPSLAFASGSDALAVLSATALQVYRTTAPADPPRSLYQSQAIPITWSVSNVAWSPDGRRVAASPLDHVLRVWGADGTLHDTPEGCTGEIVAIAWSGDGTILAAASTDDSVCLWKSI